MIIDFHTHVFPDKIAPSTIAKLEGMAHVTAYGKGTLDSLLDSMQVSGVDLSVVLPVVTSPHQFQKINEAAFNMNQTYSDKLLSFGGIHPDCDDCKAKLKELKEMGFIGIKLHPDYQNTYFSDIKYKRLVADASELGFIISVHAGLDIGIGKPVHCPSKMSAEVIHDVRPEKLVLAHTGGFDEWDDVEEFIVGSNVYLDLSYTLGFIQPEQLMRIIHNHGIEKILFATDSPWGGQKESIQILNSLPLTDIEKQKIYCDNAKKLLQL